MSAPSKQPPAAATSTFDVESAAITPIKLPASPTTKLALFIRLLGFPGADTEAEIKRTFSEWGMHTWVDMAPAETTWVPCGVCTTRPRHRTDHVYPVCDLCG